MTTLDLDLFQGENEEIVRRKEYCQHMQQIVTDTEVANLTP